MHSRQWSDVPGWLTAAQADVLHRETAALPPGAVVVEVGSHLGRSTIVLAQALPDGGRVVAVDPFSPHWRYGAPGVEAAFHHNLAAAGVTAMVDARRTTSAGALAAYDGGVDLVWIDGKHDLLSVRHDLGWSRLLPVGGRVLVHDAFSSVGVTLGLLSVLMRSRSLVYLGRTGSLARLEVGSPGAADRLRPLRELPWWVRNLAVKALLRLRLRRVAAGLGHHDAADPY